MAGSITLKQRLGNLLGLSRLVLRNLAAKTLSEIPSKLIRLAMLVLAARWLGRSEFGIYSYSIALGSILVQFADLGLQFHLARAISQEPAGADLALASVLRSKLALLVLVVPAFLLVGSRAASAHEGRLFWVLGATLILNSFVELANYLYRGFQRLEFEARINLMNVALGTVVGLVAVRAGAGAIGLASGLLVGAVAALIATSITVHRRFVPRSRWGRGGAGWSDALRASLPIGIAIVLSILYFRVDVLFLRHYRGVETVGLYTAAYRTLESFMFIPAILLAAVFPAFSGLSSSDPSTLPRLMRASLLWLLGLSAIPAAGLAALAGPIVRHAFGESYGGAVAPLRILAPGLIFVFLNYGLTHFLIALGRARLNVLVAAICLAVNASGNWLLIPRYGITAAAVTTVLTEALLFVLAYLLVRRALVQLPEGPGLSPGDGLRDRLPNGLPGRAEGPAPPLFTTSSPSVPAAAVHPAATDLS